MSVEFRPSEARKPKASEHAIRFVFGAVVTVATGLIARRWGPWVGGLFLAFPAILPASLTLVKDHDGREKASEDARGARLGSLGLVAFAVLVAGLATRIRPPIVLGLATIGWVATSVCLWFITHRDER